MVKQFVVVSCVLSFLVAGIPVLASESVPQAAAGAQVYPGKVEKKGGRKKRQLMCKECGKPEKQCECKGEEHRKEEEKKSENAGDKK